MAIEGVKILAETIVNAVTFDLLVDIAIRFVLNNSGPWATGGGVLGTVLFLTACVICAFPDIVCNVTKERLLGAVGTLLRFLLPWIGLKLLWAPGNYLLCLLTKKLFSRRCHRVKILNSSRLIFGGLCLFSALHRTGLTRDFECWLLCLWRRTIIYRIFSACCFKPCAGNVQLDIVVDNVKQEEKPSKGRSKTRRGSKKGSKKRSKSRSKKNSKSRSRC